MQHVLQFWLCRYFSEGVVDPIAVIAGLVQTALYVDFFYVYFTKYVVFGSLRETITYDSGFSVIYESFVGFYKDRSSSCLHDILLLDSI